MGKPQGEVKTGQANLNLRYNRNSSGFWIWSVLAFEYHSPCVGSAGQGIKRVLWPERRCVCMCWTGYLQTLCPALCVSQSIRRYMYVRPWRKRFHIKLLQLPIREFVRWTPKSKQTLWFLRHAFCHRPTVANPASCDRQTPPNFVCPGTLFWTTRTQSADFHCSSPRYTTKISHQ